ncbi:MAG: NUDIX domain-containing protein [Leptospiraceae bacterium]|nr:NUDIX domain-containing protein [Leptospiraceae bacterium]MCP5494945.1 NUDIX domain-containing protein [Leptospiraceae bacterium]
MDVQKSVIIIIKDKNKLLFQKNQKWNDLSFVGGKLDIKDGNEPIRAAYREVMEELDLIGGLDFSLLELSLEPIAIEKLSKRTESFRNYNFYPFLMKLNPKQKPRLESENNIWLEMEEIDNYQNHNYPISDLVLEILPKIPLNNLDSLTEFQISNEELYKQEVQKLLEDEETLGVIDDNERWYLNKKQKELGINESQAKQIEDALVLKFRRDDCKIKNWQVFPPDTANRFPLLIDDLKKYGNIKSYHTIQIVSVYNEGKTGALVFKILGYDKTNTISRILKYDYIYRVNKEYYNFNQNEKLHGGIYTPPHCKRFFGSENSTHAFLELKPADEYANASDMFSLRNILTKKIYEFSTDAHLKKFTSDSLRSIMDWFFNSIYKNTTEGDFPYQKSETPYQNSLDLFLPPRKIYKGKIDFNGSQNGKDGFIKIDPNKVFSYDLKPTDNQHIAEIVFKVGYNPEKSGRYYRIDVKSTIESSKIDLLEQNNWHLYFHPKTNLSGLSRESLFQELSYQTNYLNNEFGKYKLLNIFHPYQRKNIYETNYYIEQLLQKVGINYSTYFLHGDLNPSNILICRLSAGRFHPILIDFYETIESNPEFSPNLFFDVARLETEILIQMLSSVMEKVFKTKEDSSKLSAKEIEFILDFETKLFEFNHKSQSFNGDFIIFELRNILKEIIGTQFKTEYNSYEWYKNYILCTAIFSLGFTKFKLESPRSKHIALIWAMRQFYRFETFYSLIDSGVLNIDVASDSEKGDDTPLRKLQEKCKYFNELTKEELGTRNLPPSLFVNFYLGVQKYLKSFLNQKKKNCFFLMGESGSGKSVFFDYYSSDEFLYPVLFISGSQALQNENSLIDDVKTKLGYETADWIDSIDFAVGNDNLFIIIIENIYYNPNPYLAASALLNLIGKTLNSKIKILIACTPAFWNEYLDSNRLIEIASFPVPKEEGSIDEFINYIFIERPDNKQSEELLKKYFKEYSITGEPIGKARSISKLPGILKLFCETKQGTHIGRPDHIFFIELIERFVHKIHNQISQSVEVPVENIEKLSISISKEIEEQNQFLLSKELLQNTIRQLNHRYSTNDIQPTLLHNLFIQTGYIVESKTHFHYKFLEIPAYLLANEIVQGWKDIQAIESDFGNWLENCIKHLRRKPFYEILIYYVFSLIYKKEGDKLEFFLKALDCIISLFEYSPYGVLRIFSKSIYTLPKINTHIMKRIQMLEGKTVSMLETTNDRVLQREYNYCFSRIDEYADFSREAQYYTSKFERPNNLDLIVGLFKSSSFQWNNFYNFLKGDTRRSSNFIRNYLTPFLQTLNANPIVIEKNEKHIVQLAEYVLLINSNPKQESESYQQEIYKALFHIINLNRSGYSKVYKEKCLELIANRKVNDKELFNQIAGYFYHWLKNKSINTEKVMNHWIIFLANYQYIENHVDILAYEQMKNVIKQIKYEGLDRKVSFKLDEYLNTGSEHFKHPLIQQIIKKHPQNIHKFKTTLSRANRLIEIREQHVIYIFIKQSDKRKNEIKLLLQFKPKWGDYNWIGSQIETGISEPKTGLQKAIEIVEQKLRLSYPSDFTITAQKNGMPYKFGSFTTISRSRKITVRYQPYFYILQLKESYLLKERIFANQDNRFFSLEELSNPTNIVVSGAVKHVLELFEKQKDKNLWNFIPDVYEGL